MPTWIHDRAQHLLAKNPSMDKAQAFAIATQQSHALGKSPKGFGTPPGKREAKQKFDKPKKAYTKTPNPGGLETPKLETREKKAMPVGLLTRAAKARGIDIGSFGALKQLGRADLDPARKREIARNVVSHLRGIPIGAYKSASMRDELLKDAGVGKVLSKLFGTAPKYLSSPAEVARGVGVQMAKGRSFGGAAVDPFVAMRKSMMKAAYAALTPAGRLRRSQSVGRAPGAMERSTPSLADQVKPKGKGFGQSLPGANQGGKS